jgi:hypothetical protein
MSDDQLGEPSHTPQADLETITNRILDRVQAAGALLDGRATALQPRSTDDAARVSDPLSASVTRTPEQIREARSLRRVFHDLGSAYRDFRRSTGAPVSPEVRAAADRFRREVNLTALVGVAATLDRLNEVSW